jgi:hypothetical protein
MDEGCAALGLAGMLCAHAEPLIFFAAPDTKSPCVAVVPSSTAVTMVSLAF